MIPIIQDFIPPGRGNRPGKLNPRQYITIHETGNTAAGAGAKNHAGYIKSDTAANAPVSWHYTVDDTVAFQHLPDNETAYHAGDGANGTGNAASIGIEICVNSNCDFIRAIDNAAWLAAELCVKYGIPFANVVQHNRWTGKNCPENLRAGRGGGWAGFIANLRLRINKIVADNNNADASDGGLTAAELKTPAEITVDNAIGDGVLMDRVLWLGILEGREAADPERIKTALDRYHNKLLGKGEQL